MAVRVSLSKEKDKRTGNTYCYVVLRRKVGSKWGKSKKRCDLPKRSQRSFKTDLEALARTLDNDLSLNKDHDQTTLRDLDRIDENWISLLESAGLLRNYSRDEDDLIEYLEQYRQELTTRCSRNEIGEQHRKKVDHHLERLISFCRQKKVVSFDDFKIPFVKEWRDHCLGLREPATIQKEFSYLRSCIQDAVEQSLLSFNPVASKQVKVEVDKSSIEDRRERIPVEDLAKVEDWFEQHREDSPVRNGYGVWFALTRWTGCRMTEALLLKWSMIDWEKCIITMPAPKTAKRGIDRRKMPLYEELLPVLRREYERQGSPVDGYVVVNVLKLDSCSDRTGINGSKSNGGKTMLTFVKLAGVTPWRKIFQSQRQSRENELLQSAQYRPEAIHSFIGHSRDTYLSSYFTLDDNDFLPLNGPRNGPRIHRQEAPKGDLSSNHKKKTPRFPVNREVSDVSRDDLITPQGLETTQLFQLFLEFLNSTDQGTDQEQA